MAVDVSPVPCSPEIAPPSNGPTGVLAPGTTLKLGQTATLAFTTTNPWPVGKAFSTCVTLLVPGGIARAGCTGANSHLSTPVVSARS